MNWASVGHFWDMGGYGFYVWGSYGAALVMIAVEIWMLRARRRAAVAALKQERRT